MSNSPWDRVVQPPSIPEPCTGVVLRLLPDEAFAQLMRSHLVPKDARDQFQRLWIVVAFNDDLTERTFDLLEGWLETTDQHLLTDPEPDRAKKFHLFCDGAWNRLTKIREFDIRQERGQPAPHTAAGQFALAIHTHHLACSGDATAVDHALWTTLRDARDRANRRHDTTKGWSASPTFTSQLIDAVRDHRRLTTDPRDADTDLWSFLR